MALTITKSYADGSILTEAMLDNFRNGLLTQLNTDKLDSSQFDASMSLAASKFSTRWILTSESVIDFGTGSDASLGLDADKNFVFNTAVNTTEIQFYAGSTYYIEMYTDKLYLPGDIIVATGGADRTVLQSLSTYQKPVIEWAGASAISIQNNAATSNETVLYYPTFIASVTETAGSNAKYRQASISVTANGYGTSDTGAARGGRRSGLALTANSWYYVYACKVRSGDDYDADMAAFILVFEQTTPTTANEATLDALYGQGCWLYLGAVRYGFGATGSTTSIPKFVYSRKGWCMFYEKVSLAYATTDTDDSSSPIYTMAAGETGQVLPTVATHAAINLSREKVSDWYMKDSLGTLIWRLGWQTDDTAMQHGGTIEIPVATQTFYQVRKGTGAVAKSVVLAGFCDRHRTLRGQGHGV